MHKLRSTYASTILMLMLVPAAALANGVPGAVDASAGDCIASSSVYDGIYDRKIRKPTGTMFINDTCETESIVVGIHGDTRVLTRESSEPLGSGPPYQDEEYAVAVKRGRLIDLIALTKKGEPAACADEKSREFNAYYEAYVEITGPKLKLALTGTLHANECRP